MNDGERNKVETFVPQHPVPLPVETETLGCSRRALLKRRKLCHSCRRKPAAFTDSGIDGHEALQFCSSACLEQFKMDIFTRETLACLQGSEPSDSPSFLPHPADHHFNIRSEKVVASPAKPKKRSTKFRPHPSYRLNKRYWDKLRCQNSNNRQFVISSSTTVEESPEAKKPKVEEEEEKKVEEKVEEIVVVKERKVEKGVNNNNSWISGLIFLPIPVPVPIPFPYLVTDDFVKQKFMDVSLD